MEALTAQFSNAMNILFLVGTMVLSLMRLASGLKESPFERFSLVLVLIGAFFLILKAAHPSGTSFEVLLYNAGIFSWICTQAYNDFPAFKSLKRWMS
jgi:membrane-bound ClpP family serine protease